MKLECPSDCPLQIQCSDMIEVQNSYKADIYDRRFSLADDTEEIVEQSYAIESSLEASKGTEFDTSVWTDKVADLRASHLAFVAQNNKQFVDAAQSLVGMTDKYIGRLERFSDGAAKLCDGPRLRKRYVIFGEQIIKCSSPYRFGIPALRWLDRHDTAAKAFIGRVKDS